MCEFVVERVPVQQNQIGFLIGKSGKNFKVENVPMEPWYPIGDCDQVCEQTAPGCADAISAGTRTTTRATARGRTATRRT